MVSVDSDFYPFKPSDCEIFQCSFNFVLALQPEFRSTGFLTMHKLARVEYHPLGKHL